MRTDNPQNGLVDSKFRGPTDLERAYADIAKIQKAHGRSEPHDVDRAVFADLSYERAVTANQAKAAAAPSASTDTQSSRLMTDWRELEELMGGQRGRFFGQAFLKQERGIEIPNERLPRLLITEAEVMNAKRLGHMISLHPDTLEWRQTSVKAIPWSYGKSYLQQTVLLAMYLKDEVLMSQPLSSKERAAMSEFEQRRTELELLMASAVQNHVTVKLADGQYSRTSAELSYGEPAPNWYVASEILANLQITKLTRPTPTGIYNDIVTAQYAGIPLLKREVTNTSARLSGGGFVYVGHADSVGADHNSFPPYARYDDLGAIFSRSLSE